LEISFRRGQTEGEVEEGEEGMEDAAVLLLVLEEEEEKIVRTRLQK